MPVVLCLGYGLGLLVTGLGWPWAGLGVAIAIGLTGLVWQWGVRWGWPLPPRLGVFGLAALIAIAASIYGPWRLPRPGGADISQWVDRLGQQSRSQQVVGTIASDPQLTRDQRGRFFLRVSQVIGLPDGISSGVAAQAVRGQVYLTLPLLQITGLRVGQRLTVTGRLYDPPPAQNPNAFDFRAYLAQHGCFTGMTGQQVMATGPPPRWSLAPVRRRIVQAHSRWLGSPAGPLLSAMTLGRRAVDLPTAVQDSFIQAGLAHTLAASGFHVSLVLGMVLALTRNRSRKIQGIAGGVTLLIYIALTGIQPSVVRAGLMGAGALLGLVLQRQVRPLGLLLVAVTAMLVVQPQWIWAVGFQLSVAATLGLIVTVPGLTRALDWLPPTIATLVAIPIAAYLWTLPLQLYHFNTLSLYSVGLNAVVTPLVVVASLGGVISGLAGLLWSSVGSAIAWGLGLPLHLLMALVDFSNRQPASTLALGEISVLQVGLLYGLLALATLGRRLIALPIVWPTALIAAGLVVLVPAYQATQTTQIIVLAAGFDPVLVARYQGQTLLFNSGDSDTAFYTLLPHLRQAGINRIDWGVAPPLSRATGWPLVTAQVPVLTVQGAAAADPLPLGQSTTLGPTVVQSLGGETPLLRFTLAEQAWLWLPEPTAVLQQVLAQSEQFQSDVLWWNGEALAEDVLVAVQPRVAIASSRTLDGETADLMRSQQIELYWTAEDGAIHWQPETGFWGLANPAGVPNRRGFID
jgi:competence protein ComEC